MTQLGLYVLDNAARLLAEAPAEIQSNVMPQLALEVRAFFREKNLAQVDPETGEPWAKTKGRPKHPSRAVHLPLTTRKGTTLRVSFNGTIVIARVRGLEAMHSLGVTRGGVKRPFLADGMPAELQQKLEARLLAELEFYTQLMAG